MGQGRRVLAGEQDCHGSVPRAAAPTAAQRRVRAAATCQGGRRDEIGEAAGACSQPQAGCRDKCKLSLKFVGAFF